MLRRAVCFAWYVPVMGVWFAIWFGFYVGLWLFTCGCWFVLLIGWTLCQCLSLCWVVFARFVSVVAFLFCVVLIMWCGFNCSCGLDSARLVWVCYCWCWFVCLLVCLLYDFLAVCGLVGGGLLL